MRSSGRSPAGGIRVRPHPEPRSIGPSLSDILSRIAADETRQRISVGDLITALHDRAIGALIFVFAFPNTIPLPPAVAICVFALAVLERDGIWVLIGVGAAIAAVAIVWGVLFALFQSALFLIVRLIG
jgi:hypothetical protein